MIKETHARSVSKAVSWRITATCATAALVYAISGEWRLALSVGSIELFLKMALFYLHERVWQTVPYGKQEVAAAVVWFTGLSGAGKSTIAERVANELVSRKLKVERLDGDAIRHIFPATGFSRADRDAHIKRVGYLAGKLESNGIFVVASFVSPYREARDFVRGLCGHFVEVHVSTPVEECERRDVKGLYARARRGEIKQFTGLDDPYEQPTHAELVIDTSKTSVDEATQMVMAYLDRYVQGQ